jgi:response regulator RpfG family c-di-GMP phosphodiesterase
LSEMNAGVEKAEILVVDDEASLRDICQDALEDAGYTVYQAQNGQVALDFLARQNVDLVITDLRMPVLNGLELLKQIKTRENDSAFLVMTGFGTIETAVESMKMGASDYLPKPFNINHLLLKVEKVLKERQIKAERKKLSNLVRMLNLSSALNSQLDLRSLINEFLFHLQKNFAPSAIGLFLTEVRGRSELIPSALKGKLIPKGPKALARILELSQQVLSRGESMLVDGDDLGYRACENGGLHSGGEYSLMIVPMLSKQKKIGSVALIRETALAKYSSSELQLLTVFATHTASSIENARLYGQMHDLTLQVIRSYAKAVEAKDIYTRGHSDRVAFYATKLGHHLRLRSDELDHLFTAGVLHDIGKIGIPDQILNKPSLLSTEEYGIMKKHPEIGRTILAKVESLEDILPIIYHHHERIDGRGYPAGLSGNDIPFLARLISVVDSFEAMTSDRAYRNALSMEEVVTIMKEGAGSQWDNDLVNAWMEIVNKGNHDRKDFELPSEHLLNLYS